MPFLVFRRDHLRSTSAIIYVRDHLLSNLGIIYSLGSFAVGDHLQRFAVLNLLAAGSVNIW